ncbi:MAG: ABC transporter ATP-binding protein [Clostridia bacterium]|nr:ABC transporter ATP-binding protein [Clostridia bacterium]
MSDLSLRVEGLKKAYRLGQFGSETFRREASRKLRSMFGRQEPELEEWFYALNGVSFEARRGEALGIIGSNGAGKSTLLKVISRITAPTEGTVSINGRVASLLEIGTGFHRELTGRENIYLNGAIMGMTRSETKARLPEILEFSEIEQFIDTPVKRYSSGMSVKLGFAVAANLEPDVLICDEVLAVGDAAFQQKCLTKMSDVAHSGHTVLYVSHNMRTVSQLCNRVICLDHGRITFDGAPDAGIERYVGMEGNSDGRCDLTRAARADGLGLRAQLEWVEAAQSANVEYEQESVMVVTVGLWTDGSCPKLRLRVNWTSGDFSIGTSETEPLAMEMGRHRVRLRIPLRALTVGEYAMRLEISGGAEVLDSVSQALHMKIREDRSLNMGVYWDLPRWGNVRIDGTLMERVKP